MFSRLSSMFRASSSFSIHSRRYFHIVLYLKPFTYACTDIGFSTSNYRQTLNKFLACCIISYLLQRSFFRCVRVKCDNCNPGTNFNNMEQKCLCSATEMSDAVVLYVKKNNILRVQSLLKSFDYEQNIGIFYVDQVVIKN